MVQGEPRSPGGEVERGAEGTRAEGTRAEGARAEGARADLPCALVVMGVSGSGKTSVGRALARRLAYEFLDADDFHSEQNVAKMANGEPLTDADRAPWLEAVRDAMATRLERGDGVVMACSALRIAYRDVLRQAGARVRFVYLEASKAVIAKRLASRSRHFFGPALLDSQFATLEVPDLEQERDVCVVDATLPRQRMPTDIVAALRKLDGRLSG